MPMTLLEAAKLSQDPIQQAVIEEYAAQSDILMSLPFENIQGSGVHYNREDTLPGVGFRGLNEAYDESVGVVNPQSEALKIAGGDLDVDRAIVDMKGPAARAAHELQKVKALSLMWTRNFIKGDSRTNPRVFDGLQVRITGTQLVDNAVGGAALSLNKLDELIDLVDNPTHLIMNKPTRRRLSAAARNTNIGGHIAFDQDAFGRKQMMYADLPILIADYDNNGDQIMPFTEASGNGASNLCCSVYCVSFGEMMLTGIQGAVNGEYGINTRDLGELETKPVFRTRVDWYSAIAAYHGRSMARLRGVLDAAATA